MDNPASPAGGHDAELRITNSVKPAERKAAQAAKNAALAKTAAEMRERQAAADAAPPDKPDEVVQPREDIESIEVALLDGRKVLFGPPKGVSLTMRIAMSIPDATMIIDRLARVLMSVRSIDGKPPPVIANMMDLTKAANEIGDVGMDELNFWYDKYWGNLRVSDAQVLKKNLR